ncbi:MAG: winged helix-turn-helix domain-containing protein [Spirochaetia bacterium]|jgi:Mn-dependent DtxR family transcriptional regulator
MNNEGNGKLEDRIAECAKRIWALLEETQEVNILRLSELLGERSVIAYQALGWLARDKKIQYTQKGTQVFISRHEGDRKLSRRDA